MRFARDDVVLERRRIPNTLEHRRPNLSVLLQPGVAGKLKEAEQRQPGEAGEH